MNYPTFNPQPKPEPTTKKERKPIAKKSPKRSKEEREYSKLRKLFLETKMLCEVEGCRCRSDSVHHKKGRIADLLNDTEFWLAVCHDHHVWIEEHPEWAKEKGYSLNRL